MDPAKRPCWKCVIPGHLGRDCRKGAPKPIGNVAEGQVDIFLGMVAEDEGFTMIGKRGRPARPVPSTRPLAEFITEKRKKSKAVANVLGKHYQNTCRSQCCSGVINCKQELKTVTHNSPNVTNEVSEDGGASLSVAKSTHLPVGHSESFGGFPELPKSFIFDGKSLKKPAGACLKGPLTGGVEEQFDGDNRMAKFEKEFPVLFTNTPKHPQPPTLTSLTASLESPDIEDMLIDGLIKEGKEEEPDLPTASDEDDGNDEPCELVDSDDEEEPEAVKTSRAEREILQKKHEAEFDEFMAQRADDMGSRAKVVESVAIPTAKLDDLDEKLAAMARDINERCKALLERDGGVPTAATLNLFEELVNDSNALLAAMETEIETEVAADSWGS